jgi:hypothetical protein
VSELRAPFEAMYAILEPPPSKEAMDDTLTTAV